MGTYYVTIGFSGYIDVEEKFEVDAENEDAAKKKALQMAIGYLEVLDVDTEEDEDIWDD